VQQNASRRRRPQHDTFETKRANARLLRDEVGIRRPILLDDLAGTAHRAFGALPNMTWVLDRGGTVAYKASWTVADNVASFVDGYLSAKRNRPPGRAIGPYYTEQLELRDIRRDAFLAHLERNGRQAVEQWHRAETLTRRACEDRPASGVSDR
jgi:hypothetical protein